MGLGGRVGPCDAADSGMFIVRVLLSLASLLLIAWSGYSTEALPVQNQAPQSNEVLTKEQKDLLIKILADLAELNMTVKDLGEVDLEQLLSGKLGERSAFGLPPTREKPPCKTFFWKTFSC